MASYFLAISTPFFVSSIPSRLVYPFFARTNNLEPTPLPNSRIGSFLVHSLFIISKNWFKVENYYYYELMTNEGFVYVPDLIYSLK